MSMNIDDPYPKYSHAERVADGSLHALGVISSLIAAPILVLSNVGDVQVWLLVALGIYSVTLVMLFSASCAYHMTPSERFRPILRRIDHAMIFVKIAGTYTPLVIIIGGVFAYTILTAVWVLACIGAICKICFWKATMQWSTPFYIILGWLSVGLFWGLVQSTPISTLGFLILGGGVTTLGVFFFVQENLRFSLAIWHACVLLGAACFFTSIFIAVQAAT